VAAVTRPTDLPDGLQPGDVVMTTGGDVWEVVDIDDDGQPILEPVS
jgi:preprotein translocase subunit YajC